MSERRYLTEDVREAVADLLPSVIREIAESRTPVAQLDTETVRALAKEEAEGVGNVYQMRCEEAGPICKVRKELDQMNARLGALEKASERERGVDEAMARLAESSAKKTERWAKLAALTASVFTAINIAIGLFRMVHR